MSIKQCSVLVAALVLMSGCAKTTAEKKRARNGSFAQFHADAKAGKRLTVGFFGASLTWSANASDHVRTSYRARIAQKMAAKYPEAHFTFIDGAIGGTGSDLGVFRLQRDCLRYKPDLVFLDFSANDDIYADGPKKLATYESLVRRIVTERNCPVVPVIFPFKWNSKPGTADEMKGRIAHLKIARAYQAPVGDAIVHIQNLVAEDAGVADRIWNIDAVHPGDYGYQVFADAAWQGFENGVQNKMVCRAPKTMLHNDTYMTWSRNRLSRLTTIPQGWKPGLVNRVSAWYDGLMSRWLDDVIIAKNILVTKGQDGKPVKTPVEVEPITAKFKGEMVLIFGEETTKSGKYKAYIDGKIATRKHYGKEFDFFDLSSKRMGGNRQHYTVLATGLDPKQVHELKIVPVFDEGEEQELRLESICLAGGDAKIIE